MSINGHIYYVFGEFRFDAKRRVLWKNDEAVSLPPRATDVLAVLIRTRPVRTASGRRPIWMWDLGFGIWDLGSGIWD